VSDARRRLGQVLAGQPFPAARWELIVGADLYGADALMMSELHALPAVRFGSLADVLKAVERARHDALDGERGRRSALGARRKAEGWSTGAVALGTSKQTPRYGGAVQMARASSVKLASSRRPGSVLKPSS
jgi:hypothetical protein